MIEYTETFPYCSIRVEDVLITSETMATIAHETFDLPAGVYEFSMGVVLSSSSTSRKVYWQCQASFPTEEMVWEPKDVNEKVPFAYVDIVSEVIRTSSTLMLQ